MTDDQHRGIVASISALGEKALTSVPPAFLALLAMNCVFILGVLWFLHAQNASRERVLSAIVAGCMRQQ